MFLCVEKSKNYFFPFYIYHITSPFSVSCPFLLPNCLIFHVFSILLLEKKISAIQSYIVHSTVLLQQAEMLHKIFFDCDQFSCQVSRCYLPETVSQNQIYFLKTACDIYKKKYLGILVYFNVNSNKIRYKIWKCSCS